MSIKDSTPTNPDITASQRKSDHINLAFESQTPASSIDNRFYYEPMLAGFADNIEKLALDFLGKKMQAPMWVSSMTGGTAYASTINTNLAKACGEYGLGMGLGSCRQLLYNNDHLQDFSVRKWMNDQPLYANLGIAQIEQLLINNQLSLLVELVKKLEADGLIIHINPLQEASQAEGDFIQFAPIDTIKRCLDLGISIIVKEVGQGFGPESMQALMQLPLAAIDFGASGGTNFALLELLRRQDIDRDSLMPLIHVGHTAEEMIDFVNSVMASSIDTKCHHFIISGGVKNFLDGYYLTQKCPHTSVYGMASEFLKYSRDDYDTLSEYVSSQIKGLTIAHQYLKVR